MIFLITYATIIQLLLKLCIIFKNKRKFALICSIRKIRVPIFNPKHSHFKNLSPLNNRKI